VAIPQRGSRHRIPHPNRLRPGGAAEPGTFKFVKLSRLVDSDKTLKYKRDVRLIIKRPLRLTPLRPLEEYGSAFHIKMQKLSHD